MANLKYLTENKLRKELQRELSNSRTLPAMVRPSVFITLLFSIPSFLILLYIFSIGFFITLEPFLPDSNDEKLNKHFIFCIIFAALAAFGITRAFFNWFRHDHSSDQSINHDTPPPLTEEQLKVQAGADGEDLAIAIASELPDDYTLLNQVDIPSKSSKTGFNEADLLIAGPRCIFIIEVKHNTGKISGNALDPKWRVEKTSTRKLTYESEMRNPIKQVKNVTWLLNEYLKAKSAATWVQSIVLFTNENVQFALSEPDVPILTTDDLNRYIESYNHENCTTLSNNALQALVSLKR